MISVTKRYFDAVVTVPLEEEFETALSHFQFVENLSTKTQIRFAVTVPNSDLTILLIKQNGMGKTENQNAAHMALADFDAGSLICLGIAGGLSNDVNIGDVCYTGSIYDLHDNAKATDTDLAFSPKTYETPLELAIAINLDRVNPETKPGHEAWRDAQEKIAKSSITGKFLGKRKALEEIQRPTVREGAIACGAVSDSPEYNKKVKDVDRRMLAIETESGGLFSVAKIKNLPALTVRGISDYAGYGIDKNLFEEQTNNKARFIAASNAATFLARQFARAQVKAYLIGRRGNLENKATVSSESPADRLARILLEEAEKFENKLRELAPTYSLQAKGYRLPVPRVRIVNTRLGTPDGRNQPIELRDGLKNCRVLILQIPPQYPDLSLSWIIARDLLLAQFGDKQVLPTVVEADDVKLPDHGLRENASAGVLSFENVGETQIVFIIDSFNFESRTKVSFLLKEVERFPNAKFIIVTRNKFNIVSESQFAATTAATVASICDVSFLEISHFLQRNFEMASAAAEVVAVRLGKRMSDVVG
jgi:nucleoside phosphorylase